jgi:outer membrane receptor protein involved in Fe transport
MPRARCTAMPIFLVMVSTVLIPGAVRGQERAATITGTVSDAGHYVLPGARIELQPKGQIVVSDQQGQFTIAGVTPGQFRGADPRLSNVTINGILVPSPEGGVRNVKLDVIPSDLVASIEVNKTLSANQDGDAIGGSVNLVTKTAGDETYVTASAMGGYTNIVGGRGLDQFTSTIGRRFGESKRGGLLIGGSYDWNVTVLPVAFRLWCRC